MVFLVFIVFEKFFLEESIVENINGLQSFKPFDFPCFLCSAAF